MAAATTLIATFTFFAVCSSSHVPTDVDDLPVFDPKSFQWDFGVWTGEQADFIAKNFAPTISDETKIDQNTITLGHPEHYQTKDPKPVGKTVHLSGYSSGKLCFRVNNPKKGPALCPKHLNWTSLWPVAQETARIPFCWLDAVRAHQKGNKYFPPEGTEIVTGKCPGVTNGKWNGQYDWRYGGIRPEVNRDEQMYDQLKEHIEALNENGTKRVILTANSGGTTVTYAFLMHMTLEWRQANIAAYVAQVPVYGGTLSSMQAVLVGFEKGKVDPDLDPLIKCLGRGAAIFLPSVLWYFPRPGTDEWHWHKDEVVVYTPSKNYSAYDLEQMLTDMGLDDTIAMLKLERDDLLDKFEAPGIDTYVFYGYGVPTEAAWRMPIDLTPKNFSGGHCENFNPEKVYREKDNGDGLALVRSTARASQWKEAQQKMGAVLQNRGYKGMPHGGCHRNNECKKDEKCVLDKIAGKHKGPC